MNSEPLPPTERIYSSAPRATSPSLHRAPYLDPQTGEWVLSRFADVQAAFLAPGLCPIGAHAKDPVTAKVRDEQARFRAEAISALTAAKLALWESAFASQARNIAAALPIWRAIEVVEEFARPWSIAVAVQVTGANGNDAQHLARLAAQVSAATAKPDDPDLEAPAKAAGAELDEMLKHGTIPMAGPAFVGLSQTLPCLLANIWHALLQHPQQLERLHETPNLVPKALEELLRFAGMVHVLHRQAIEDVELDGMRIKAGQRLRLMLGVAHRDGEQFEAPEELDTTRRLVRHFTFGSGPHSCAAAPLLRMATTIATRSFVEHFTSVEHTVPVFLNGGEGFRWPAPLYVIRREDPPRRT